MKTPGSAYGHPSRSRLAAIFPGTLGDFICFLPALERLAREGDVDLYARSEFADIAPPAVRVRAHERYEINRLFAGDEGDDERLRRFFEPYRRIYSWMGSQQASFVGRLQRVAPGRTRIFAFRPPEAEVHQSDYYLRCLAPGATAGKPEIALRAEAIQWSDDFCRRYSLERRPRLTIAPGSGAREKNWPEENFLEVARWWQEATSGSVLVLVGPVEEERGGMERLKRFVPVARELTLAQLAALLKRSDFYLGNDSGVSHLAGALGTCGIVLFGPSDARQWAPRGENLIVLRRGIDCSPCAVEVMKSCPHRACLTGLGAGEVIERITALLRSLP